MKFLNIKFEGTLFSYDLLTEIAKGKAKGQKQSDFNIKTNITDEISASWSDTLALWKVLQIGLRRLGEKENSNKITRERFVIPLLETLGFKNITPYNQIIENQNQNEVDPIETQFQISHRAGNSYKNLPIQIQAAPKNENEINNIDKKNPAYNIKLSPHSLMQEYLNRTDHLWGIVTNGYVLRIVRTSARLSKPTYIEFDIKNIIETEDFPTFQLFFRIMHYTRWYYDVSYASEAILELYYQQSIDEGSRVREKLRDNVDIAIRIFANGFLKAKQNQNLRNKIKNKQLPELEFYRQLLKLIYRILFLMVSEERNLVGPNNNNEIGKLQRKIYNNGYCISRLRTAVEKPIKEKDDFYDIWEQIKTTFLLYSDKEISEKLGIKHLNGDLFGIIAIEDLQNSILYNRDFIDAFKQLSLFRDEKDKMLKRINYVHIDIEELGSVYESLLDYHPVINQKDENIMQFEFKKGTERKTTGSYYTNPELVKSLIKSALIPVIEERISNLTTKEDKVNAILNIKVIDPSCGSGHFLLESARTLGKVLATIITEDDNPNVSDIRKATRQVIKHCIYGVDLNQLAIDLCKVGLWIEGHNYGEPLTFLDHRIKCGNSLIGIDFMSRVNDGIPNEAFNPVTGDVKDVANKVKALNKLELKEFGEQMLLTEKQNKVSYDLAKKFKDIDIQQDEKLKEELYRKVLKDTDRLYSKDIADIWTSAFFFELDNTVDINKMPTTATLRKFIDSKSIDKKLLAKCNKMSNDYKYFHWELEFPEIFKKGGFDVVLGNVPWERVKLEEQQFFFFQNDIVNADNASKRKKLINKLKDTNTELYDNYIKAKHFSDCHSLFARCSGRFNLTGKGDINKYPLFAELNRIILNKNGISGNIYPTGIATSSFTQDFFKYMCDEKAIISFIDYENKRGIFNGVHRSFKFCLVTSSKRKSRDTDYLFFIRNSDDIKVEDKRKIKLSTEDIKLLNPNTNTLPIFRTKLDAEITKKIYKKVPVLINENTNTNIWDVSFMSMFHMSNDSNLFYTEESEDRLPLYEAKMMWYYDHRYGTYDGIKSHNNAGIRLKRLTKEQYNDFNFKVNPYYYIDKIEVNKRLKGKWDKDWLVGFRQITGYTNERTSIFSILPYIGVGGSLPLLFSNKEPIKLICLLANLSSIPFDYISRQKLSGTSLTLFTLKQFPVIPPDWYSESDISYIKSRVLELSYTSYDLKSFAVDIGYDGEPFNWDEDRRLLLKCELDAYYSKLYGLDRSELEYILDPQAVYGDDYPGETFRVLKEREVKDFGEYRTKRLILEAFDKLK